MNRFVAEFFVRNDKSRGILIESISSNGSDLYYFQYHDQPLDRHCIQLQSIIRSENVKRSRKVVVDVAQFYHEYQHPVDKTFQFKGIKLLSNAQQVANASKIIISKEIGKMKRAKTIAENKQRNIAEHNTKLEQKMAAQEYTFQIERARRIHELTNVPSEAGPSNIGNNNVDGNASNTSMDE